MLLHKHKKFAQLYPLGGHIEPAELPHEAALREVFEESGLEVKLIDFCGEVADTSSAFVLPAPAFLLHENKSAPVQNLDFVYAAITEGEIESLGELCPMSGESKLFFWVGKKEIETGSVIFGGEEYIIPAHIKSIAKMVFERFIEE